MTPGSERTFVINELETGCCSHHPLHQICPVFLDKYSDTLCQTAHSMSAILQFMLRFSQRTPQSKNPRSLERGFCFRRLAMTYSRMGRPHTTIGDDAFHGGVRDGIQWFHVSIVARQTDRGRFGLMRPRCRRCAATVPNRAINQLSVFGIRA